MTPASHRRIAGFLALALGVALLAVAAPTAQAQAGPADPDEPIRVATFNASLNRASDGELIEDLSTPDDAQAQAVAEIVQSVRPDVLLINEFDFNPQPDTQPEDNPMQLFLDNYLAVGQNGQRGITYQYAFAATSNTGVPSGFDLDNDGQIGGPGDAFGFGFFPGQFGMAVFSRFPIRTDDVRTFQNLLWADMPGARLPDDPDTPEPADWYTEEELDVVRLSSKGHWDVPIDVGGQTIHLLASHPTPPVFDGPEDRNGLRNADEIRFWADYISGNDWMTDDRGASGGLAAGERFVIAGDQNADPFDGDSVPRAAQQLILDPLVNTDLTPTSAGGPQQAALQGLANDSQTGSPVFDTADFADDSPGNLRVDYVLPSRTLGMTDAGVFWPDNEDPEFAPVGTFPFPASDHRLTWVDVTLDPAAADTPDIDVEGPVAAAVAISQQVFDEAGTTDGNLASWAIIGRDDLFADSLAGSALAGRGPLLLTGGTALDPLVPTEIDRVLGDSGTVYLLGGPTALSEDIQRDVEGLGYDAVRLAGPTRVETAVAIAEEVGRLGGTPNHLAVARAYAPSDQPTAAWADSIAAGPWAASQGAPILLTPTDAVHPAVATYLATLEDSTTGPSQDSGSDTTITALGGSDALADPVVQALGAVRIDGVNRYATAASMANELYPTPRSSFTLVDGASDDGWAYGLPAASLAAADRTALLLFEPDRLPQESADAICASGAQARYRTIGPRNWADDDALCSSTSQPQPGAPIVLPDATSAEGITAGGQDDQYFAGELDSGDIFRGDIIAGTAERFIEAPDGRMAVGLAYDALNDWLFVAGGETGRAYVYDASSGDPIAEFDLGEGFINDVTVTPDGAWFTNSQAPTLSLVPIGNGQLDAPVTLDLSGPAADTSAGFNNNGIAATGDGTSLFVAHSGNAQINVVDASDGTSTTVEGLDDLVTPDGILFSNGELLVVENSVNRVASITVSDDLTSGAVFRRYTNPDFDVPTTVAAFGENLAVVNAKFSTPDAETYEVVVFSRGLR